MSDHIARLRAFKTFYEQRGGVAWAELQDAMKLLDDYEALSAERDRLAKELAETIRDRNVFFADLVDTKSRLAEAERQRDRGRHCLMEMMQAYERRVRSDCTTPEQIAAKPWECAEYIKASRFMIACKDEIDSGNLVTHGDYFGSAANPTTANEGDRENVVRTSHDGAST